MGGGNNLRRVKKNPKKFTQSKILSSVPPGWRVLSCRACPGISETAQTPMITTDHRGLAGSLTGSLIDQDFILFCRTGNSGKQRSIRTRKKIAGPNRLGDERVDDGTRTHDTRNLHNVCSKAFKATFCCSSFRHHHHTATNNGTNCLLVMSIGITPYTFYSQI